MEVKRWRRLETSAAKAPVVPVRVAVAAGRSVGGLGRPPPWRGRAAAGGRCV